ncbi:MAG: helix-turn-helix transcriptional regulator [Candidatus Omnitrophica bacterium]|nr:helix-turn-helix transcriptional regulator [Candidatus Omnitrophota bacterium]
MRKKQLAQRLAKRIREERGDTPQMHFCRKLGISNTSLHRIEMGDQNVSLKTLEVLCERLKCDVGDLFPPLEGKSDS